jgi:hypothetical protein
MSNQPVRSGTKYANPKWGGCQNNSYGCALTYLAQWPLITQREAVLSKIATLRHAAKLAEANAPVRSDITAVSAAEVSVELL